MSERNRILIVSGGIAQPEFVRRHWKAHPYDYVIAADGALSLIDALGLPLHCLVGDFDSVPECLLEQYEKKGTVTVERHSPQKDETDTELAMRIALEKNASSIAVIGATGGRLDHFLGNLHLLLQPLDKNIPCVLLDEWNRIRLIRGGWEFSKEDAFGTYISFLPFTDEVSDVSLEGFLYPLCHADLKKGNTLGVSNEQAAKRARVQVGKGILICVESRDRQQRPGTGIETERRNS